MPDFGGSGIGGPEGPGGLGGGFGPGGGGPGDGGGYNAPSISAGLSALGSQAGLSAAISSGSLGPGGQAPPSAASLNADAKSFRGLALGFLAVLTGLVTGSIPLGIAFSTLVGKYALTPERASSMIASVKSGQMTPEQASQRGASESIYGSPNGGPADVTQRQKDSKSGGTEKETDPKSASFWEQFVEEWQTAKENMRINDDFKKTVLSPAFDTYQQRLSGLSNEDTFKPINVKMGDFETSFMPKRAVDNAGNILSSQIAEADVMQPKSSEMSYLDRLQGIGQFEQELKNRVDITKLQKKEPKDKGSTTDAITDWLGIIKGGSDLWGSF